MEDNTKITGQLLAGVAVADALDDLATLRLDIFPEYPYLYQGRREDELAYLVTYAETPDACVILTNDGLTVIGAVTGMPLVLEDVLMRDAFAGTPF